MVRWESPAIQLLKEYSKELDKIKVSKAGMDGTLRNPAALVEEMKAAGLAELKPAELKPSGSLERNWNRKCEAEMVDIGNYPGMNVGSSNEGRRITRMRGG